MARKTKEDSLKTRNKILEAASIVFFDKGVANSGLEEIAEKAGVTRGAVYWHFKNKADIFKGLFEQVHNSCVDIMLEGLQKNHPEPLKQLEELCVEVLLNICTDKDWKRALSIFTLKADYSGELGKVLSEINKQKKDNSKIITDYFKRAQAKGHLSKQADPQLLTISYICFMSGVVNEYLRSPKLFDLEKNAAALVKQFFNSVK